MTTYDGRMNQLQPGVLKRFPGERPSLAEGKEWCREARLNLKPEWRALLDGAEVKELIKYRDTAMLTSLVLTAADATGTHTAITQQMVENRDRENLKIAETNVANTALREAAIAEWRNEFWLAFEVALHDVAPIRLEALRVTYRMTNPNPITWVDGVSAFRALENVLVTNAVARPGEAISHDDVLMKLRLQPMEDGCTVDEFSSRINNAMVKHIPFLDRPFINQSAISRWVIQQLPPALAVDGRSLVRTMTAAQMADTPGVIEACIDLVSSANDSNKNFKEITEMIGAAIPGGEQQGRRPAGLGKGGGRGGDSSGGRGGKGAGAGGKGAGGKGAGGKGASKPKPTACSVLPPRGPMCDKAHHNDCWRDPRCSKALPSWVKPEVVVQIDKDKRANALRLNEAVVPRVAAEFTGAVSASGDAHAWDDEDVPAYVVDESYDADDASQAALSTPIRCSICSVAPCACDRFILGGQGFSGTAAHVQDAKCSSCDYDPCACELLALRASQRESRAMPLYVIGEPCCWLQADQTIAQGKIIAPCNVNGDARTLDKNGKSWLINSTSIWTGPAALAVGDVAATTPQNFPVARSEPGPVTRSQSMLGYGHLGTVRPLPASMTQQAGSVQPTPLQHVGTPSGPTGGLGAGRSAGDKLTASTDGKVVSTPVGGATVGPGTVSRSCRHPENGSVFDVFG